MSRVAGRADRRRRRAAPGAEDGSVAGRAVQTIPQSRTRARVAWPDRLRVVVIAGVVVAHTATAYLVDIGWYYEERTTSEALRLWLLLPIIPLAVFGLMPLFVVAGMFAARSLGRHGPGGLVRSRLLRLGVPLLAVLLLVDPLADYLGNTAEGGSRSLPDFLLDPRGDRDLGVFWFVAALLAFTLAYAAWRALRPARAAGPAVTGRTMVGVGAAVAVASAIVWLRWDYLAPTLWNVRLAQWPAAAGLFVLGVRVGEQQGGWWISAPTVARCRALALGGLLAFAVVVAVATDLEGDPPTMPLWGDLLAAPLAGVTAVALSVWLVSWFDERWGAPLGPWWQRAARGSYATYVVHPLVLVALSAAARPLPVSPVAKFVIVATLGVPAAFGVGYLLTRVPGIRAVL